MRNAAGSIFEDKRRKGVHRLCLELPPDPTGKRNRQTFTVRGSRRQAELRLAELLHQRERGGLAHSPKVTLSEYLEDWLAGMEGQVRSRTLEGYRTIVERHLIPKLGGIRLAKLQAEDIRAYYRDREAQGRQDGRPGGLARRTVLHHHRVLFEALEYAVKGDLLARNPARAVRPPKAEYKEMQVLDAAGIEKLLEATRGKEYYHPLLLAVSTGLRRSELLGLRWGDIDLNLEHPTLSVNRGMHCLKGGKVEHAEPKSARSRRQMDLPNLAALALRSLREKQEADFALVGRPFTQDTPIFSRADGSRLLPNTLSHAFKKVVRQAGLGNIRLHDLRHTLASLMLRADIHPKVVSEQLGHSSVGITLDIYSHVVPALRQQAAKRIDEMLSPAVNGVRQ